MTVSNLLSGCASTPAFPSLLGLPVVGTITKVIPVTIFEGDLALEGQIYEMKTASGETIAFNSLTNCPGPVALNGEYVVLLMRHNFGYSTDLPPEQLPALTVTSCAKVDPASSYFSHWNG
jgi:hypothetical protein